MNNKKIRKITIAALLAAMVTAATYIRVPCVIGYVNMGDLFVILSGWIAGPLYGGLGAAVGSVITDFMLGYAAYMPATFVIKWLVAASSYFVFRKTKNRLGMFFSALLAETVMVAGYFVFESVFLGLGLGALASVPYNCIQGAVSFVGAILIFSGIKKNPYLKRETEVLKG